MLAASGDLLAFDFDGTLAPIGEDSVATRMREESAELLRHLAHVAPVAVITRRSVRDVTWRLEGASLLAVIGIENLVPHGAPDKGEALTTLVRAHGLPGALFVGDGLTDEPAFRVTAQEPSLGIRVGRWSGSAATFHIPSQLDIDALLTELLIGRTRPRRNAAAPVGELASAAPAAQPAA